MLKILMVTSEVCPFAKTGGLADVLGSLPRVLNSQEADVRVIMPKYSSINEKFKKKIRHVCFIYVNVGWRKQYCGIEELEHNGVKYYFIDNEYYFKRENIYGYEDDCERFAFFSIAVMEALAKIDFIPDIIHCHDWQAGMIPVIKEALYRINKECSQIKTVFTIHNLKYQGVCGIDQMQDWFSLKDSFFTHDKLEMNGYSSFMKGGLTYANLITTVSETYAIEIRDPFFGEGLEGLLNARKNDLKGILNGVDYKEYNSVTDNLIYANYSKSNMLGKKANKAALQNELGLEVDENKLIIGLISRLVDQKGLDLIQHVFDEIMQEEVQFVVLGTGDHKYENFFRKAVLKYPGRVSANIKFNNTLAHKIYAASDMFLMPSLFEPCGLGQIISLRYGTIPIVRETGGLKDTVIPYNEFTGEGNGFGFVNYNAHEMLYTIQRAIKFCKKKTVLNKLRKTAMSCDFSWNASAKKYLELYNSLF